MDITQFQSEMTPDQAKAMIGMFTTTILNDLSGEMGKELDSLKLQFNASQEKLTLWLNGEKTAAGGVMRVQEFVNGITPCIDGEKANYKMETVDAYLLEITRGEWKFEIYGKDVNGAQVFFEISPIQIIPYVSSKKTA